MKRKTDPILYVHLEGGNASSIYIEKFVRWTEKFEPQANTHRHSFNEIIWFQSGSGQHDIDGQIFDIVSQTVSIIAKGQVHAFIYAKNLTGFMVRFTDEFLQHIRSREHNDYQSLFTAPDSENWIMPDNEQKNLNLLKQLILLEYEQMGTKEQSATLRYLVWAFLIKLAIIVSSQSGESKDYLQGAIDIQKNFIQLLEQSYTIQHQVGFYAKSIGISNGQLGRIIQKSTGKNCKQLILERIVIEAKRYLQFTDFTIKQISNALGYEDQSHFSKLFKQLTKSSPQQYRESMQKNT